MTLDELFRAPSPPDEITLSQADLRRLYWKHRGLQKDAERDHAYWEATNQNLKKAYETLDEQERQLAAAYRIIRDDLEVASRIQTSLMPSSHEIPGLECAVYHKQLTEVGGDYYDFFRTRGDATAIGVFDISGHGVSAALVMAFLKAQFMLALDSLDTPDAIVDAVNARSFAFLRGVKKYATVNFAVVGKSELCYACGGGFGLLLHGDDTHVFEKQAPFLGLRRKPYAQHRLPFVSGDLVALYTDGMVEAQDTDGRDYSVARLNDIIVRHRDAAPAEILARCLEDYEGFRSEDTDDITLLIARRTA